VIGFYLFLFFMPVVILGDDHHGFRHFLWAVYPFVISWGAGSRWFQMQQRIVESLDDRAQVAHGLNFDQLSETAQGEILRRYHGGRRILDAEWYSDERQEAFRSQAKDTAYRILRTALPWFLAGYWVFYLLVPDGNVRDAFMDAPMMISWLAVFVVTLPSAIEMWTEPDEVGEARVI
jgi:hypothetical protein